MRNFWPRSQYSKTNIYHRPCHRCPTFYSCAASSVLENGDRDRSPSPDGSGSTNNIPGIAPVQSPEVRSIEHPAGVSVELLDGGTAYCPGKASAPAQPEQGGGSTIRIRRRTLESGSGNVIYEE